MMTFYLSCKFCSSCKLHVFYYMTMACYAATGASAHQAGEVLQGRDFEEGSLRVGDLGCGDWGAEGGGESRGTSDLGEGGAMEASARRQQGFKGVCAPEDVVVVPTWAHRHSNERDAGAKRTVADEPLDTGSKGCCTTGSDGNGRANEDEEDRKKQDAVDHDRPNCSDTSRISEDSYIETGCHIACLGCLMGLLEC